MGRHGASPASKTQYEHYGHLVKGLVLGLLVLCLVGVFLVWRIDSPRIERLRAQVIDRTVPAMQWAMGPISGAVDLIRDYQGYTRLVQQNQDLRRELQQMKAWKEAAMQLEQENARLLDLNNLRLPPRLTYVSGVILADSGSPFRQSVLLNIGARDGLIEGWATMDGLGLVGRIAGVGESTSRVILLTDTTSRIPAVIQPSGQTALISGNNTTAPWIEFVENPDQVRPGDRILTTGDGSVFPANLLIGRVALDPQQRLRAQLAADYGRLKFLRVLRYDGRSPIEMPRVLAPSEVSSARPPAPVP
ncbi:MAG: rod shape-determining protein MreC [Rhodobacteraceae bacterium]|nr:rod shape-determining protein MreC [Paracoccaceae bacterium]